jgi:carbon storage regulator CsrA
MLAMLVLSRKPRETIVFPNLGITLEIVRIDGGKVRVGIDAPSEVAVLRGEIAERLGNEVEVDDAKSGDAKPSTHRLRNRLHTARLGLKLLEKQLAGGLFDEAEETLARALGIFRELDSELERANHGGNKDLGRRALLVEDDANEAHLLAGILRMSGYVVETAQDGFQALELLKKNRPDFVLLDMNMPRCDGPTTLASIRANPEWRGLRIFAVTGCSQREIGVSISEVGVDRWFQKPVDPEVLLGAMSASPKPHCVPA